MEVCGVGTYIRGGLFHPVWEIGRFTGGNSVSVQIPGKNPVPIWRQLDGDSPEHQKVAEFLGQAGNTPSLRVIFEKNLLVGWWVWGGVTAHLCDSPKAAQWSKHCTKSDANNRPKMDAFPGRVFNGFWWIL